uniref:Golgi apparatus membrane protein TVP23 n=1 Tax=Pyramimonas obovata TaxID=1411642 RepID=A0A7S0RZ70_9CHLO|mmetsp:Transcript_8968/g.18580  ORF Transcript_8968/g.18580 Transcript_8968/m.18580 type:complete len:175 (+) Transcript_8968:237-761(+)|eukprot:CAMPEP_0118926004 /NCGR_PEP_ID=MMETSP1169-20130426/3795_1 /TAXON_ID=36882 /ORGANISM="Pyramimonas obovata, Strain CCMP722" /LENGTH=174 /DNA_ID=CAMNT_0006867459 /DNA_START=237 /DNA_END=761 /DNA_ORIENTATION=-
MVDFSKLPHPKTTACHIGFKVAALLVYILCEWFNSAYVFNFISVVMLLAIDFWTVKNVSGRLLVGLRWWNEITDEGDSLWKFESLDAEGLKSVNTEESRIFWYTLYLTPMLWAFLAFVAIIKLDLDYLMITVVAIVLSGTNIVGYSKGSKDAKQRLTDMATQSMASSVFTGSWA